MSESSVTKDRDARSSGRSRRSFAAHLASPFALLALLGCGGDGATTVVQGKITYNGKPVTQGLINFQPGTGQPLGGAIQSDGTYEYELPPGEYQVRIETPQPASASAPQEASGVTNAPAASASPTPAVQTPVPPQYANYQTSGLTLSVGTDSPQQHDINLP